MLPRSQRVSIHLFEDIMKRGGLLHSPFFVLRFSNTASKSRFAISVPKKVAKTATERNKIKRRVYSILRKLIPQLKQNMEMVMIVKSELTKLSHIKIEEEIRKNFVKSGFLK
jgi:ribonuclease P protein component